MYENLVSENFLRYSSNLTLNPLKNQSRCLSACEKDKFDVILGHGDEGEEEGEVLLTFTINDRFYSEEEQEGLVH